MAVAEQRWTGWRTSSYSNEGSGNCVEVGWRTSSYSGGGSGNCVEVAVSPVEVGVRDSKNATGPTLAFPQSSWQAFITR
ncbi:MAG TPA: DUF397 domain-containing protein [Pseudonocardiaceae bacterium]|jgi:hypothetical protein|nr:DUF397 domain-containing protein [Pseudonocardiaceae bacterium]